MARIRHVAVRTMDVEKTSAFYREVFGLRQVGRGHSGVYLSDGYINLAILKSKPATTDGTAGVGIDHLGFHVDDVEGTLAKMKRLGGKPITEHTAITPTDPSNPQSYFEVKCLGPDDQEIDISGTGWVGAD